jgi:membrane-bound lytic murein transglycosylase B
MYTRVMQRALRQFTLCAVLCAAGGSPACAESTLRPDIDAFITAIAAKDGFEAEALRALFAKVRMRPKILRAMSAPSTAVPWHEFRPRYVEPRRIAAGVAFWAENEGALVKAQALYGVPEEISVATIGVETLYGRHTGSVPVLDALATLAFDYPRRAAFFRRELEEYLLLGRELSWDAAAVRGSYAGAMGLPQFLPSSYRKYAVDFDQDGTRDIIDDADDAIGSVANYYASWGWQAGAPVVVPAMLDERAMGQVDTTAVLPERTITEYVESGVAPLVPVPKDAKAALLMLETQSGPKYWLTLQNFYVITRYNRSVNYAMAVYQLAQAIREAREADRSEGASPSFSTPC